MLDAGGCVVAPGFVDLHAHLREPGREEAETIETGSRAAALGGFTAVVAMPNTDPAAGLAAASSSSCGPRARRPGCARCCRPGCITMGRAGEALAPFAELVDAGVRIFTDDGNGVQDPLLMRRAMEYSLGLDIVLAQHCEVARLTGGAVMHEGRCCSELGLPGWPAVAEELMVHRDIELARLTGARIHLLHLSTARSVELVRAAKADGLRGHRRGRAAPPRASPTRRCAATTRCSRSTRRCAPPTTSPRSRPGSPTARSTPSPPTTPRTRSRTRSARSTTPRRGCSAWRRRSAWRSPCSTCRWPTCVAALSWKPAAIAGVADRHGVPIEPGSAGQPRRVRPRRALAGPPGGAGQPQPQHAVRRAWTCAAGSATPSSAARRSSIDGVAQR